MLTSKRDVKVLEVRQKEELISRGDGYFVSSMNIFFADLEGIL